MTEQTPSHEDVVRLLGTLSDHKIVEILDSGASLQQLEEVAAWLAEESDVMGEERKPLTGVAARVYEIVAREEEWARDEEAPR